MRVVHYTGCLVTPVSERVIAFMPSQSIRRSGTRTPSLALSSFFHERNSTAVLGNGEFHVFEVDTGVFQFNYITQSLEVSHRLFIDNCKIINLTSQHLK